MIQEMKIQIIRSEVCQWHSDGGIFEREAEKKLLRDMEVSGTDQQVHAIFILYVH